MFCSLLLYSWRVFCVSCFVCFKQKTAYEMRISDWSSDVCSSELLDAFGGLTAKLGATEMAFAAWKAADERLALLRDELEAAARDREWLDHAVGELTAIDPRPGEEAELAEARAAMQKGARLGEDLSAVAGLLDGSDGDRKSTRLNS